MLEINNLSKEFPVEKGIFSRSLLSVKAVQDVSFKINRHETTAFIGESGSGKTSIIDLICCLLNPTNGSILVDGKEIDTIKENWQNSIGYVPQNIYLLDDTIKNNIAYGSNENKIDLQRINQAIQFSNLDKYIESLELGINSFVGENGRNGEIS